MATDTEKPQDTALAKRTGGQPPIGIGPRGVVLTTMEDAYRFATAVVKSGMAPKGVTTPEQALVAIQYGMELGFSPMRALSAVTVINGRGGLMGDAALAKIRESGICSRPPVVTVTGDGDARAGVVVFQRRDMDTPVTVTFSVADAKKAKLWGKAGPWSDYSDTMLGWRAVARMGKLYFGDVLMGLVIADELQDYPAEPTPRLAPPVEPDPLLAAATPAVVVVAEPRSEPPETPQPPEPAYYEPEPESAPTGPESQTEANPEMTPEEKLWAEAFDRVAVAVEHSGLKRAALDIEISAATGGKIKKTLNLNGATIEQLAEVEKHLKALVKS